MTTSTTPTTPVTNTPPAQQTLPPSQQAPPDPQQPAAGPPFIDGVIGRIVAFGRITKAFFKELLRLLAIAIVGTPHVIAAGVQRLTCPALDALMPERLNRHGIVSEQVTPVLTVYVSVDQLGAKQKPLHSVAVQSIVNQASQEVFDKVAQEILQQGMSNTP